MTRDRGLDAPTLRGFGYAFGIAAVVSWIIFAVMLGDGARQISPLPWLWMAAAVMLTVSSGVCAVLSAFKAMEARIREDEPS